MVGIANKVGWAVAPGKMLEREQMKNAAEKLSMETDAMKGQHEAINAKRKMMANLLNTQFGYDDSRTSNSGYSHGGATRKSTWSKYPSESGSAKKDIEMNRKLLRERSRELYQNSALGRAAIDSTRTNVVGSGLLPNPRIDHQFLGMTREAAREIENDIKREFALWAESTLCDNNDQNNFYELQQIAFSDWLRNGEEFVLIKYENETPYMPYQLRLKLVEADRVSTENSLSGEDDGLDKSLNNGNIVVNGVEIAPSGKVEAYWISSDYPDEYSTKQTTWTRVKKRGDVTGNPNILHIFNAERADQYRGVPFLAPVIRELKQLTRYTDAEIMAAVVNSFFNIFITTETGHDMSGFSGADEEYEEDANEENVVVGEKLEDDEIKLGSGTVTELKPGEKVEAIESTHPSGNFDGFVTAFCTHIGAALEIAPEVLLKKFSNNFSASKGALNETWKSFKMRRKWFINDFCQEVYVLWFSEAVSKGRIKAPGYFNNPLIKAAYTKVKWNGPSQGYLNPLQEVEAAGKRLAYGLSTHEDECASGNGSSFEDNVRTLQIENELLASANAPMEGE